MSDQDSPESRIEGPVSVVAEIRPEVPASPAVVEQMRSEWDERAKENARYYVANSQENWSDEEYFASGRQNVADEILIDMKSVCQGKDPKDMSVIEIGCGSGRITRALAGIFGRVYAVDISGEMINQAKQSLKETPNAYVFQNSGADLSVLNGELGEGKADFAFSYIVFQHIPSREVVYSYVREVYRFLRPGALFKFQVQGFEIPADSPPDSWLGVSFTDDQVIEMARECGFHLGFRYGAGTQYFWLWFFKPA